MSIQEKDGMELAMRIGVLEEGIPNVRLFHRRGDPNGAKVMVNELPLPSAAVLQARIEKMLVVAHASDTSKYIKAASNDEM